MEPLIRIVTIKLGPRSYPVHIGDHLLNEVGRICRGALLQGRAAVVSNSRLGHPMVADRRHRRRADLI